MALSNINATLTISFSTNGFTAVQPSSPTQLFTPATGQRAYTLADTITSLNNQINANTDPTSTGGDSPDVLYNFQTSSDGMILIDVVSSSQYSTFSTWDGAKTYLQGTWQ